jgi:hypothetical protein
MPLFLMSNNRKLGGLKALVLGLGGAAALGLSGCREMSDGEVVSIGAVMLGAGSNTRAGAMLRAGGSTLADLEAARLSQPQVNVTVVNPSYPSTLAGGEVVTQQQPVVEYRNPISGGKTEYSVAFNYWLDEDEDNSIKISEFKGISNNFDLSREKQISFATYVENKIGKKGQLYIYNSENQLILQKESDTTAGGPNWIFKSAFTSDELRNAGASGRCLINWKVDDKVSDAYYVNFTK